MVWRNLLFISLMVGGGVGLVWTLYPRSLPPSHPRFDEASQPDFATAVNKLDTTIEQSWRDFDLANPIQPAPLADELTVARRLSLALVGTVPSLQEIRQLEKHPEAERINWYAAHLLEDRRFADYFAERLARAYVGTENGPFVVYRRRRFVSWLSDQLHANRPYDQIVRDLIASKGLWTDSPATNFVTVTIELDNQKGPNPERLAGRVTKAFLGVRLDCAQCHNHPFAEWKQDDFQGLAAMFGQTNQGLTGVYEEPTQEYEIEVREKVAPGDTDKADGDVRMVKKTVNPAVPVFKDLLDENGTRRERLARWVTHPKNVYFARATVNRVWALMFGRGMVQPLDDVNSSGKLPEALKVLADDFVEHQYDLRRLIKVIAATRAFHRDSAADIEITEVHERFQAAYPMTRLRPEQIGGSIIQAASLQTVNRDSHVFTQLQRFTQEREFVERYGDAGEDEFDGLGATIPQGLLLMNGDLVKERTAPEEFFNAAAQIAALAPDDGKAVEVAYLTVLTRRPTPEESDHFVRKLRSEPAGRRTRAQVLEDLCWTLLNSTEFSWNH